MCEKLGVRVRVFFLDASSLKHVLVLQSNLPQPKLLLKMAMMVGILVRKCIALSGTNGEEGIDTFLDQIACSVLSC